MPEALESCKSSLLAKWQDDPGSKPKRYKKGDKWVPLETAQDAESAAFAICTASLKEAGKMEADDESLYLQDELEFPNPVMTGFGFTNRPHIHDLDPISVVDENGEPWKEGEKFLKVPLILAGKWRHPRGVLNFTKDLVGKIVKNFKDRVTGYDPSGDCRHLPQLGALAWPKKFLQETRQDGRDQFSALARPTDSGLEVVEGKRFRYGSIEFHPNWSPNALEDARVSAEEIQGEYPDLRPVEINLSEEYYEEGEMPPEDQEVTLEQFDELKLQLSALQADNETIKAALEQEEARRIKAEQYAAAQFVDSLIVKAEARRDGEGRAHSKLFLEWLADVLKMKPREVEEGAITLEDAESVPSIHTYYRRQIFWLAENMPGVVPLEEPRTEPDKTRPVEDETPEELSDEQVEEVKAAWDYAGVGEG
jgi:hypothetical protein